MIEMPKISAVIPVYNEEKTIGNLVETLLRSPTIDEVICVYDRSDDNSLPILRTFGEGIKLITHNERMGKGFALAAGVRAAQGEIIAFFDGDLLNLSQEHIITLVTPLVEGKARAVLGCHPAKTMDRFIQRLIGTRAYFREDLLPYLGEMEEAGFGVEVLVNSRIKDITRVTLKGLQSLHKHEKFSRRETVYQLINEGLEVAWEVGRQEKARLADFKILEKMGQVAEREITVVPDKVVDLSPLRERIATIKNKPMRDFLMDYFRGYFTQMTSRIKSKF